MEQNALDRLIKENQTILEGFAAKGTDLSEVKHLYFSVYLSDREEGLEFRAKYMSRFTMPDTGVFVLVNEEEFRLVLAVEMKPNARTISEIEENLTALSNEQFGSAEVGWEFEA